MESGIGILGLRSMDAPRTLQSWCGCLLGLTYHEQRDFLCNTGPTPHQRSAPIAITLRSPLAWASVIISIVGLALMLASCVTEKATLVSPTVQASVLVEFTQEEYQWFRNIPVHQPIDAYALTESVTEGHLTATYYPTLRSHMINSLLGREANSIYYWALWRWNTNVDAWELIPVGADLFIIKNTEVHAWKLTDSRDAAGQTPIRTP